MKMPLQRGSVHIVVIAVLVVALSAALGIIFYQNFIAKPTTSTTTDDTAQQQDTSLTTIPVAYDSMIYEFTYPKNWTAKTGPIEGDALADNALTITNKDKTVEVVVRLSHKMPNGACDTLDGLKVRHYTVRTNPSIGLVADKLYIVESVTDAAGGGYNYAIGLTPDGGETHAALGDSRCTVKNVGLASVYLPSSTESAPTMYVTIQLPKLTDNEAKKVKSIQEVTDLIMTDDYKAAVKILESGRQK